MVVREYYLEKGLEGLETVGRKLCTAKDFFWEDTSVKEYLEELQGFELEKGEEIEVEEYVEVVDRLGLTSALKEDNLYRVEDEYGRGSIEKEEELI